MRGESEVCSFLRIDRRDPRLKADKFKYPGTPEFVSPAQFIFLFRTFSADSICINFNLSKIRGKRENYALRVVI